MAEPNADTKANVGLNNDGNAQQQISAVAIKLPTFWKLDPLVWFAQAEAQFTTRAITSETTKYAHVIQALPQDVAQDIRDVLINPPTSNPYTTLKEKLISRVSASEQRRVQLLLTEEELGDRTPSQLLRRMQQHLGEQKLEKGILKQLFLQRLPNYVRLILASTNDSMALSELAELADKILEAHMPVTPTASTEFQIAALKTPLEKPKADPIESLTKLVTELSAKVDKLQREQRDRSRSRGRGRYRDNSASRKNRDPTPENGLCWYHNRFADKADRCKPPCNFEQGNE